jgi:hypothetical protein
MVMTQFPERVTSFNYDKQSIAIPGSEKEGYSPIYQNATNPGVKTSETIYDLFHIGREK